MIDKRAIIDASAKIAEDAILSPYAVIGPHVEIGSGTWIGPHAVIRGPTKIGEHNKIYQFASVGEDPQDKKYHGEVTGLEIGDNNVIREFVTIHRGTVQDAGVTRIGNGNLLMAYVHIAHDCQIENHTIFTNNASLAGHVHVEDYVILGGFSAVYQFCRLGKHCFISAFSMVNKDVLPYTKLAGIREYAKPCGLNIEGLRRRGFDQKTRTYLNRAYKIIYRQGLTTEEALVKLQELAEECSEIKDYIDILKNAKYGIIR